MFKQLHIFNSNETLRTTPIARFIKSHELIGLISISTMKPKQSYYTYLVYIVSTQHEIENNIFTQNRELYFRSKSKTLFLIEIENNICERNRELNFRSKSRTNFRSKSRTIFSIKG